MNKSMLLTCLFAGAMTLLSVKFSGAKNAQNIVLDTGPSTLVLVGTGIIGLLALVQRKKK